MSITLPPKVAPGDVIRSAYHNMLVDAVATLDERTSQTFILAVPLAGTEIPYGVRKVYVPYLGLAVGEDPSQDVGFPLPFRTKLALLKVYAASNSLNKSAKVTLYRNGSPTIFTLTIPAGQSGLFVNDISELVFDEGDRLTIVLDTSASTSGSITLTGISLAARIALEGE